jgi:hypothetical protein
VGTTAFGFIGMAVFLAWPQRSIDPNGVPTVVFAVVGQILIAFSALVALCLASFVASVMSIVCGECRRMLTLAVSCVDAVVLALGVRMIVRMFHGGL